MKITDIYLLPNVKETFFYGNLISGYSLGDAIYIKSQNKYCFRLLLVFESGDTRIIQRNAPDKMAARQKRDQALMQIAKGTFIPFSYTVREFYDYWFYHYIVLENRISYNTYASYRSIIENHIIPVIGCKRLGRLQRKDLIRTLRRIPSPSVQKLASGVLTGSLRYAKKLNYLADVIYNGIHAEIKQLNSRKKKKACKKTEVYSTDQAARLLYLCREKEPQLYLPMLLAVTAGLRISEVIGLKYEDIDFLNKKLAVNRQLGRKLFAEKQAEGVPILSQEIKPKTQRSIRKVSLADFVLDEIQLERQRYEKRRAEDPCFHDLGYICYNPDGQCYNRSFYEDAYNRLIKHCVFPRLPWRKFRNTYATILDEYEINIKTISKCLGHYSPDFTSKVYVAAKVPKTYDIAKPIEAYITANNLLPDQCQMEKKSVDILPDDSVYIEYYKMDLLP